MENLSYSKFEVGFEDESFQINAIANPDEHWNGWAIPWISEEDIAEISYLFNIQILQPASQIAEHKTTIACFNQKWYAVELDTSGDVWMEETRTPLEMMQIHGVTYYNIGLGFTWAIRKLLQPHIGYRNDAALKRYWVLFTDMEGMRTLDEAESDEEGAEEMNSLGIEYELYEYNGDPVELMEKTQNWSEYRMLLTRKEYEFWLNNLD